MDDPAVPACSIQYSDLTMEQKPTDLHCLMKQTMVHVCSGFCMREKNGKRVCKAGCGMEKTKFKCDTPGFPLRETAEVKYDHKRSLKLYMPQNHARINQTSSHMLQSWRANCDVQLLIYSGDPACPDLNEISRVTDYVVAYSCKGNITWKEEKEQTKQLVKAAEEFSGDKSDIARVAKKVMNRAASKRIISRQECMLLLSDLPLVQCTETIESVSINNSKCISNGSKTDTRLVTCYAKRSTHWETMSLKDYFLTTKNAEWHYGCDRKYMGPAVECSSQPVTGPEVTVWPLHVKFYAAGDWHTGRKQHLLHWARHGSCLGEHLLGAPFGIVPSSAPGAPASSGKTLRLSLVCHHEATGLPMLHSSLYI